MFPLGDTRQGATSAPRPPRAGWRWPPSPTRHDICFVADGDTAGLPGASGSGRSPGAIVDARPARSSASTTAPTRTRSASGTGCGSAGPAADGQAAVRARGAAGGRHRRRAARARRWTADRVEAAGATGAVRPRRAGRGRRPGARPRRGAARGRGGAGQRRRPVALDRPVRAAAPGQTAALYAGTRVVGSATITAPRARRRPPVRPDDLDPLGPGHAACRGEIRLPH